jgi:hypothetical protein
MNNNFKQLLERFSEQWESVTESSSLEEVETSFSALEETREDILNWVFDNIQDEEEQGTYFSTFGSVESNLAETYGGIPVFDDKFDIYDSFDEYEAYYQRYGCLVPEFVISWDSERILWSDDLTIDVIKRPDVLMSSDKD